MFLKSYLLSLHLKKQLSSLVFTDWLWETNIALLGILRLSQSFSIDSPAPHFLCPLVTEFLSLHSFSESCNCQTRAYILPFFFFFFITDVMLSFFPGPRNQASLLHMLTIHLQRCSCCHWEYNQGVSHGVEVWRVKGMKSFWCSWAIKGNLQARCPQWLMDSLHDGDWHGCRIRIPFMSSQSLALLLVAPWAPNCTAYFSILDGAREKWVSLAASHICFHFFPTGGSMGWEGLLSADLCCLGRRQSKTAPFTLFQGIQSLESFLQWHTGSSPSDSGLSQKLSHPWVII